MNFNEFVTIFNAYKLYLQSQQQAQAPTQSQQQAQAPTQSQQAQAPTQSQQQGDKDPYLDALNKLMGMVTQPNTQPPKPLGVEDVVAKIFE